MGGGSRHHSVSEFDGMRSSMSNVQGFYQNQRFGPRGDTDQMMQTKRRMAAQRERELRNYHQEQQYNRSKPTVIIRIIPHADTLKAFLRTSLRVSRERSPTAPLVLTR